MTTRVSRTQTFPEDLFSSCRLGSLDAVDGALAQFEVYLNTSYHKLHHLIEDILQDQQHTLPLVLSSVSDNAYGSIRAHLSSLFRVQPDTLIDSVAHQLLTKLSHFFLFTPLPSALRDAQRKITADYRTVEFGPGVLNMLPTIEFADESPVLDGDGEHNAFIRTKNRKRKKPKHTRTKSKALDPKPFRTLGYEIPSSRSEAQEMGVAICKQLENIMEFYLDTLRNAEFALSIRQACVTVQEVEPSVQDRSESKHTPDGEATVGSDIPTAYPKVQPMKSALHFDSVVGFGEWVILISQNADTELRTRHRKDKKSFEIIVKKIKELSNGHFSADNQKRLNGPDSEVPVFEAKMTGDLRLIYQIDVVPNDDEREENREKQAIKIFGIYTHAQMDNRMWHSISRQLDKKGKEYRDRCTARVRAQNADSQTFVPALFPPLPEVLDTEPSVCLLEDEDPVHSRFLMDKYVVLSQPLMNTMLADLDATFPHLVSTKEKQIIEHPYSCYVIGRSGTGKTTTLLFKMLLVERTHQMAGSDVPKPRQIFVTQSRVLAKKVEQYFATLGHSLKATSQTLEQLRQTQASQVNSVLDEEGDMIDEDDIVDRSGDLPTKFSELRDEHFPLFTTFNELCAMLEADIAGATSLKKKSTFINGSERGQALVTYEVFLRDYWPHFPQSLASRLDPSLVFSELIGVIKGSEEALEGAKHHLDASTYQNLSVRNQSTFAEHREDLYNLFISYLSMKKRRGDADGADRTHAILDFFKTVGIPGQKIDHLYVDEVQDNLLIDTLILRALCHDENGLFWAGDTAQTISVGSSFKFSALKAFQWRLEQKRRTITSRAHSSAIDPEIFQLSVNYRSHSGIVDCAGSVVELITRFWKDSIDRLAPEKGVVEGLKPLFFVGWDEGGAGLDQFVFGDSGNRIEFGAHQCILVRDEVARDRLRAKLGEDVGLIMTIYDSKGLEFNDVLLYNFFDDSPAKLPQWRVILNALRDSPITAPDFERNKQRYASICVELKFLYVAITRARENVWIVDSSENSEPMRLYWTERDLIQNIKPEAKVPRLATSSSPEDWAKQGRHLFERKKYAESRHCFERASEPDNAAIANAYVLRQVAERTSMDSKHDRQLRNERFRLAGDAFLKCSQFAGRKRRLDFFRLSGNCYEKASEFLLAAGAYRDAQRFTESVLCYRRAAHFDEAVEIVQQQKEEVDATVADDTIRLARMFYFNQVQSLPASSVDRAKKLQQAGALFDTVDDQLEYLEDRDFDIARATLLVANGRMREAAELHLSEGRTLDAVDAFLQDNETADSPLRACECILEGLWGKVTFGVGPENLQGDPTISRLLNLVERMSMTSLTPNFHNEISMFKAIVSKSAAVLRQLSQTFAAELNPAAALLCLDHYFTPPLRFRDLSVHEMVDELGLFHQYIQALMLLKGHAKPADSKACSKLFGFQRLSDVQVLLPIGTYLNPSLGKPREPAPDQDRTLSTREFLYHFRFWISKRLQDRITEQSEICRTCSTFTPCLTYAVFTFCHRGEACPEAHIPAASLDTSFYIARVRIHLQQIQILRVLHAFQFSSSEMIFQRRFWLARLYSAISPPSHVLGTMALINIHGISEWPEAVKVVQEWLRHLVYTRDFYPLPSFVSDLMRATILAQIFDKEHAQKYLYRGRYAFMRSCPSIFMRHGGAGSIAHELIGALEERYDGLPTSLVGGMVSLKHVMLASVPVDLGILCDSLDRLCGSLILVACSRRDERLHNVTLPRSWILRSHIVLQDLRKKDWGPLHLLVEPIADLLAQIYTRRFAAHLLYDGRDMSANVPNRVRTIFIARICRAICLLGYNIPNQLLRNQILRVITSLKTLRNEQGFPPTYNHYVTASSWNDLASAVRRSIKASPMDEMIVILHKSRADGMGSSTGVRPVVYDKLEDLPKLLLGVLPPIPFASRTRPAVQTNVRHLASTNAALSVSKDTEAVSDTSEAQPKLVPAVEVSSNVEDAAEPDEEVAEDSDQIEDDAEQMIPTSISGPLNEPLQIPEPTQEEHRAASTIQVAYRKHLGQNSRTRSRTQLAESRERVFLTFLNNSGSIDSGRYKKMFLGPLPHILVFLELLYTGTQELKNKTKKRTRLPLKGDELNILDKRITQTNAAIKKITSLKKSLSPDSELHTRKDCLELRKMVRDIELLIGNDLPITVTAETMLEFQMGFKGIAMETAAPRAVTKDRKPELNAEDVFDY